MSSQVYDSSAVDDYLNELSAREAEVTRSRRIENFRREVPYQVLKIGGVILALAILFYFLGLAIGNARSYEVVIINETNETRSGYAAASEIIESSSESSVPEDKLIDIDGIIKEQRDNNPPVSSQSNQGGGNGSPPVSSKSIQQDDNTVPPALAVSYTHLRAHET